MDKIDDRRTAEAVIKALGGCKQTARYFRVTQSAVSQWRTNGVPQTRMLVLEYARPDIIALLRQQQGSQSISDGA